VVSLAAALSIQLTLNAGEHFPYNTILFISFGILVTLVLHRVDSSLLTGKLNIGEKTNEKEHLPGSQMKLTSVVDRISREYARGLGRSLYSANWIAMNIAGSAAETVIKEIASSYICLPSTRQRCWVSGWESTGRNAKDGKYAD